MIDLKLNNAGDIVTRKRETFASLKFNWSTASYASLRFSYKTRRTTIAPPTLDSSYGEPLRIAFECGKTVNSDEIDSVTGMDEVRQHIIVRLRSNFEIINKKHEYITDEKTVRAVKDAAYACIEDLLEKPRVEVKRQPADSPFSSQNLDVYIYDGGNEIYNFKLEE